MKLLKILLFIVICFVSCSTSPKKEVENEKPPIPLTCDYSKKIFDLALEKHIDFRKMVPELEERALLSFINRISPTKAFILKTEVDSLTAMTKKHSVFEDLGSDCSKILPAFYSMFLEITKRYTEKVLLLAQTIKQKDIDDFKISDIDIQYSDYPKDIKELDERVKESTLRLFKYLKATDVSFKTVKNNFIKDFKEALSKINEQIKAMSGSPEDQHDKYLFIVSSLVQALDAHTIYTSFTQYRQNDEEFNKGFFYGVGIVITKEQYKGIKVKEVYKNGPAGQNGVLRVNDIIFKVNGTNVIDIPLEEGVKLIKGPKGTKVKLDFLRTHKNEIKKMSVTIVRNKIHFTESIKVELIERDNLKFAFIKLDTFFRNAADGVYKKYLATIGSTKIDGIILDLTQNGGGLLAEAIELTDHFIDRGPVVATKHAGNRINPLIAQTPGELANRIPMIVLVNLFSASASEIVAGALKDYNRAIIVGSNQTFGKGSVQDVIPISGGKLGGINVTIAKFFRPSGKSTQLRGVGSHIVLPSSTPKHMSGEKDQLFPVAYEEISPLIDPKVQYKFPYQKHLPTLIRKSQKRVSKNKVFAEFEKDRSDIDFNLIDEEKPFRDECVNILVDYITLARRTKKK